LHTHSPENIYVSHYLQGARAYCVGRTTQLVYRPKI